MRSLPLYVYAHPGGGVFFWKKGTTGKIRMKHQPADAAFNGEYLALMAGAANNTLTLPVHRVKAKARHINSHKGSVGDLAVAYFADHHFQNMKRDSQRDRRRYIEACLQVVPEGEAAPIAHWEVEALTRKVAKAIRKGVPDPKRLLRADRSDGVWRDAHMKAMRALYEWGIENDYTRFNAFSRMRPLVSARHGGAKRWRDEQVAAFIRRWPKGTRPYLALMLLIGLVVRRSDLVKLGSPDLDDAGVLHFTEEKNGSSLVRPVIKRRAIKLRASLRAAIDATPGAWEGPTFLKTERGNRPYTRQGFGCQFRKWCDAAGLAGYSAHGIRKHVAAGAAEMEMGDKTIAALLGHTGTKNVPIYTEEAESVRMFEGAMDRLQHKR